MDNQIYRISQSINDHLMSKVRKCIYEDCRGKYIFCQTQMGLCGSNYRPGNMRLGEAVLEGHAAAVLACVQEMKDYLLGKDPSCIEGLWEEMYRAGFYRGGGVLMSLLYSALATGSSALLGLVGSSVIVSAIVLAAGILLLALYGIRKKKLVGKIFGIVFIATGALALLEALNVFSGVPYLTLGIPGVLSLYFDVFSGFVQALVFSLLTMVYVGSALPGPEESNS